MDIVKPSWEEREYLGVGGMLYETVNQKSKDKKPIPNLPGAVLKAILANTSYPESLYSSTLTRIRAEQGKITWGRAAIIKAYLIQNRHLQKGEEFVGLNSETNDTSYGSVPLPRTRHGAIENSPVPDACIRAALPPLPRPGL